MFMKYESTKIIELGSCAFRQWRANHSHCKFVHGYRLVAKFWFGCNKLDDKNWVVDFGGLKGLKTILENQFDHTLCIASDDPLIEEFRKLHTLGAVDLRVMENGVGIERTAEWCLKAADAFVRNLTSNRCWVTRVEVWEHEKNSAIAESTKDITNVDKFVAEQFELFPENQKTVTTTIKANPGINTAAETSSGSIPAPITNHVTTGLRNPFAGTSWGL